MDEQELKNFPDELRKKIIASRKAYLLSIEIDSLLNKNFSISNLQVAATADGVIAISGAVTNEDDKQKIEELLFKSGKAMQVINSLIVSKQ